MGRRLWVVVHRWAGLYMALILTVAGLTGAILAFDEPLNEWLNPGLFKIPAQAGPRLDPYALREAALALEPRARINFVTLDPDPGDVGSFYLEPRLDPVTGQPYDLGPTSLLLDPYTGAERGRLSDEALWPVTRKNLTQVLFALHTSLCAGEVGRWAFGIAAILWTLDSFVALYLTFPARRRSGTSGSGDAAPRRSWLVRWRPSWLVKWGAGAWRLNFDLHRASGLWLWPLLFAFATSSVAYNLPEVYGPVMRGIFRMPDPWAAIPELPSPRPDPKLGFREAAAVGARLTEAEGRRLGFTVRQAHGHRFFMYDAAKGVYSYPSHTDGDVGFHHVGATVYLDGDTGAFRGIALASGGHWASTFTTWVSAIHTAVFEGQLMHAVACLVGLVTAGLSITGVYLWLKKRSIRRRAAPNAGRSAPA